MKKPFLTAAVAFTFLSCDSFMVGGPCEYEDKPFRATIVSIEKATERSPYEYEKEPADLGYTVKVLINVPRRDTIELDEMVRQKITAEYLQQHPLEEGDVISGVVTLNTRGNCGPSQYRFSDSTMNDR